jgi:hypothetical protein
MHTVFPSLCDQCGRVGYLSGTQLKTTEHDRNGDRNQQSRRHACAKTQLPFRFEEYTTDQFVGREKDHDRHSCGHEILHFIKAVGKDFGLTVASFTPISTATAAPRSAKLWIACAVTARLPEAAAIMQ